ncbi:ELM1/GtrOC1 family putative glycosyltransferase [Acinetobacter sp. MD2(2019)]|uniref:ELM1/GtrOC1 family putative glycosyltransferase n=1 Tax=Acinetobacter sp. MD2(2019) TaxID=2605273 RepID=UPI002D1F06A8|nr:ELM1/GtrOC1 family putative glycosyltransferase [Acinetobacter sp. MD2(2019)]MEB3754279.1 mitochondrial fission ELM1 family protein [Acinetobacter sp. MD2(2019)]
MQMVYISDGKAGHRSQALGLFHAIQAKKPQTNVQEILVQDLPFASIFKAVFTKELSIVENIPDWIVGVGQQTHLRVWLLGKIYPQAKTIILMKPSLPIHWFNYSIIPEHDGVAVSDRVIVTKGALNPMRNEHRHQPKRILITLGGSSKRHQWNDEKVLTSIQQIAANHPDYQIILTTSRRTPANFLAALMKQDVAAKLELFPVEETPRGWIYEQMQLAEAVWVTEDSVSMIYEALTAGCRVGVILIDRLREDRITQSVDRLLQQWIATAVQITQLPEAKTLQEAKLVVDQLTK